MNQQTQAPSGLELAELELVVIALAEYTVLCRQAAVAMRRNGDVAGADAKLRELMAAGILQNRLSLELTDRAPRPPATLEQSATCSECGGRGGRHEIDCDLRPLGDAPEPRP